MIAFLLGNWARFAVYGLLIVGALGTAAGWGYHRGVRQLWDYQAAQAVEAIKVIVRVEKVKEIIREVRIKRETVIQTVFQTIEKETENATSRAGCNVVTGWVRRHDTAADGEDRRDGGSVDDATDTGIGETVAQGVVIRNYKAFHQVANDLRACRAFVTQVAEETGR